MAFGLLVTKWRIFDTPINVKFSNLPRLLNATMRLHNYCIDNREATIGLQHIYKVPDTQQLPHDPTQLVYIPTDAPNVVSREGSSHLRTILTNRVQYNNLSRPRTASTKQALEQEQR
jgi:hypothetical protein